MKISDAISIIIIGIIPFILIVGTFAFFVTITNIPNQDVSHPVVWSEINNTVSTGNQVFNIVGVVLVIGAFIIYGVLAILIYKATERRGKNALLYVLIFMFVPFGWIVCLYMIISTDISGNLDKSVSENKETEELEQVAIYQSKPLNRSIRRKDSINQNVLLSNQFVKPIQSSSFIQPQDIRYSTNVVREARVRRNVIRRRRKRRRLIATCSYCGGDVPYRRNPYIRELFICSNCGRKGRIKYFGGKPIFEW